MVHHLIFKTVLVSANKRERWVCNGESDVIGVNANVFMVVFKISTN
jgi:hypothetical protein